MQDLEGGECPQIALRAMQNPHPPLCGCRLGRTEPANIPAIGVQHFQVAGADLSALDMEHFDCCSPPIRFMLRMGDRASLLAAPNPPTNHPPPLTPAVSQSA